MQEEKTNVMRFLEQKKVVYRPHWYACPDGAVDGISVAALLGKDAETVFKTLVTQGASKKYYVFVIPAQRELDLKAAAKAAGRAVDVSAEDFDDGGSDTDSGDAADET